MELEVKVLSHRSVGAERSQATLFTEAGGEIGRGIDCLMMLDDPTKTISRRHGRIVFEGGRFYYVDNSAAGTEFFERSLVLLQDRCELHDGDRFRIGDYELAVSIRSPEPANPAHQFPYGAGLGGVSTSSLDNPFPTYMPVLERDPFGPLPGSMPISQKSSSDSFIDQPEVAPFHESFVPPTSVLAPVPGNDLDEFDFGVLLSDLEGASSPAIKRVAASDFQLPEELLAGLQDLAQSESSGPGAVEPVTQREPRDVQTPVATDKLEVVPEQTAIVEVERLQPQAEPRLAPEALPRPGLASMQAAHERPAVPSVTESAKPVPPAVASDALFRAFLEGAGIREELLSDSSKLPETMHRLGGIFRELVDGVMTVLRARNELKSQFRVSMTTMRAANNNPLKFTASVDDALKLLIQPDHPGFLAPQQAVHEGVSDVMNHQLAMTAGIQASLAAALRRFNPEGFERTYQEGIVFQKKAKCWDAFVKAYPQISQEILENIFGDEFAEVYERQMQILRSTGHGGAAGGSR